MSFQVHATVPQGHQGSLDDQDHLVHEDHGDHVALQVLEGSLGCLVNLDTVALPENQVLEVM